MEPILTYALTKRGQVSKTQLKENEISRKKILKIVLYILIV